MKRPARTNHIDLNLFVVFDAIYREENLTRASETLCLSQPAVSHALARLRERLDDPLFERKGKHMRPTPLAQSIAHDVRAGLESFERSIASDVTFDPAHSDRNFQISIPAIIEASLLQPVVKHLLDHAPGVSIKSQRLARPQIEKGLKQGRIDLALDTHVAASKDIGRRKIAQDRLVVLLHKDNPILEEPEASWDLDSYLRAQHIFVSNRQYGLGAEDYALSKLGKERHVVVTCQHHYVAFRLLENTNLLLTIPETYARILADANYVVLALPFEMEVLDLYLYWLSNATNDPANQWLRDLFQVTSKSLNLA